MGITPGMKDLAQEITSSYEERVKSIGEVKKEVQQAKKETWEWMKQVDADQQKTRQQLLNDLAQNRKDRKEDVKAMREDFRKVRSETRDELMKDLAQARKDREKDVQAMREEVLKIRTATQEDLKEAAFVWSELIKTMAAKKSGEKIIIKEKSEETLPPPGTRKKSVPVKIEVPTKEEVPAAESIVEEGALDLEDKVLSIINEHPNGITLMDIAEKFGVVPVVLGRASRSLLEKGKIRKEEKLYYPVIGE